MAKKQPARVRMVADIKTDRAAPGSVATVLPADVAAWEAAGWVREAPEPEPAED